MQRFKWVQNLQLSCPIVVVRMTVGGQIGVLNWVIQRPSDANFNDDLKEVDDARKMITTVLPKFLQSARRRFFLRKVRLLFDLRGGPAKAIYKELTGDESSDPTSEEKKRQAAFVMNFVHGVGDPSMIGDLRIIENAKRSGKSSFEAFWDCLDEVLNSSVQAAQERRHGGVVTYASELIAHKEIYKKALEKLDLKKSNHQISEDEQAPSCRWMEFQFWPANEHVLTALNYTRRFAVRNVLQKRVLRKYHAHVPHCMAQKSLAEDFGRRYLQLTLYGQVDDKAKGNIGEKGAAVSFLQRQKKTLSIETTRTPAGTSASSSSTHLSRTQGAHALGAVAMDHEVGMSKTSVTPTVMLNVELTANSEDSKYRGQVTLILKDSVYEPSEANQAALEIKKNLMEPNEKKTIFLLHTDGGGEHNVKHPSVIFALINLFLTSRDQFDKVGFHRIYY